MRTFCSILIMVLAAPFLQADRPTEEVIAKARQYLGGDTALDAVSSISYEGDFTTGDGATGTMKIIFQKPLQQRVEIFRDDMAEVSALNDFDGWRKVYDVNDESRWTMELLDPDRIRELQANTWENLSFFRGIEKRRGWIENKGAAEIDGRKAVQLVFHYPRGVAFTRFFDVEDGRLLATRTQENAEIREHGTIRVNGVVFPEKITMSRDGKVLNEIRFRNIKLNEKFDHSLFDIPSLVP
jgi:hypothetical protein